MQKTAYWYWHAYGYPRTSATIKLAMKLTFVLLTAVFLTVHGRGLSQTITLSGRDIPLNGVFAAIEKQTGYTIFYNKNLLRNRRPVSVQAADMPLNSFLQLTLRDQSLEYSIENKTIFIFEKKSGQSIPPEGTVEVNLIPVSGIVLDADGKPLQGATLRIKGKAVTAMTDEKGNFKLEAPAGSTLIVSFVGFHSREVKVTGELISVLLERSASSMDTTTVYVSTGYQRIARERSAGSFAQPDMGIFNERSSTMDVLQRLDGLIPGLVINNSPTAATNPILIRGLTSINGSRAPLYVVDGVAVDDVSTINPNDVGSITVLKDATAASIWGSRASNGVIVITTKKGSGGKLRIDYDAFYNFQGKPEIDYYPVLSSRQYIDVAKATFNPVLFPYNSVNIPFVGNPIVALPPHEQILYDQDNGLISAAQAGQKLDSLASINNVGQMKKLLYRNAGLMNHTLSLSGSSGNYSAYGSFSYTNTVDDKPGDKNNRYKLNVRQDLTLNKFLSVYLITDLTNTVTTGKNNITPDDRFIPYALFQSGGKATSMSWLYNPNDARSLYEAQSGISLEYKPLEERDYATAHDNNLLARINAGATVKLIDGLTFQGVYGYIKGSDKNTYYEDARNFNVREEVVNFTVPGVNPGDKPTYYLPTTGGRYTVGNTDRQNWTVRNQLVYDKAWGESKHQLNLLFGQEAQQQLTNTITTRVYGYNPQLLTYASVDYVTLGNGISGPVIPNNFGYSSLFNQSYAETEVEQRFTSYYANAAYTYDRKYTVNGSWRIDQSNLFGKDKSAQNKPIWSVGGAWLLSNEKFMQNVSAVNRLSMRLTYGITGNSPLPGTASSYDILSSFSSPIFPGGQTLQVQTPANGKLTWETTATTNLGFDFVVLNNRVSGSVDLYNKNTSNLIGQTTTNLLSGYSSITGNFGNMYNRGVELSLRTLNVKEGLFSWHTLFNFSYNRNKITNIVQPAPISDALTQLQQSYVQGYSSFALFAYRYAGLDETGDPRIRLADGTVTKERSIAKPTDLVYKGSTQPKWSGGFSNSFDYGNFGLSVNMVYSLGNVMRRDVNTFYSGRLDGNINYPFTSGNVHSEFLNRWQAKGDEAKTAIPSYIADDGTSMSQRDIMYYTEGDINVLNAGYIKVRDIVLAYSLPSPVLRALRVGSIKIRAGISNLMLWKANKYGIDPEFQNSLPQFDANYENLTGGARTTPINQHTYTLGLHVTF